MQRASALTIYCAYCHAQPGEPCSDPSTGYVLEFQPAHFRRLQDAQVVR
jgi:hypothetical protein